MKRFLLVLGIGVLSMNLLAPSPAYSLMTEDEKQEIAEYKAETEVDVKDFIEKENFFMKLSLWNTGLVILLGLLGVAASSISNMSFKSAKIVVTFIGITISGITTVSNTVFTEDFRSYDSKVAEMSEGIEDIKGKLENFSFEEYDAFTLEQENIDEVLVRMDELSGIVRKNKLWWLFGSGHNEVIQAIETNQEVSSSVFWRIFGPNEALAAKRKPTWLKKLPKDKKYYLFVGVGTGSSSRQAFNNSKLNADQNISDFLKKHFGRKFKTPSKFDRFKRKILSLAKKRSTFNERKSGKYEYFVLMELSKNTVRRYIKRYS
jgi:hypothetical protein